MVCHDQTQIRAFLCCSNFNLRSVINRDMNKILEYSVVYCRALCQLLRLCSVEFEDMVKLL
jgi:hypothetical protein